MSIGDHSTSGRNCGSNRDANLLRRERKRFFASHAADDCFRSENCSRSVDYFHSGIVYFAGSKRV